MGQHDPWDRIVHAYTAEGHPIVRYERASKWYIEPEGGKRRQVTLRDAAEAAVAGRILSGGQMFRAVVRRVREGK